jgi:hypothetical protein
MAVFGSNFGANQQAAVLSAQSLPSTTNPAVFSAVPASFQFGCALCLL